MAVTETLSVRLSPQTRRFLAEAAITRDVAGASALARDILEKWAADTLAQQREKDVARVTEYVKTHPKGWDDDPGDFFPGIEDA